MKCNCIIPTICVQVNGPLSLSYTISVPPGGLYKNLQRKPHVQVSIAGYLIIRLFVIHGRKQIASVGEIRLSTHGALFI